MWGLIFLIGFITYLFIVTCILVKRARDMKKFKEEGD